MKLGRLPLYLSLLVLTQCSKCKDDPTPADPASQLPPATQTGANTFGCLVNGQPYTPQGRVGLGANFAVSYDPTFNGGDLIIGTYRVTSNIHQYLVVLGNHVAHPGTYEFGTSVSNAFFTDATRPIPCGDYDSREAGSFSKGIVTITRLDLQAGIISGVFSFTLAQSGCDTLKVTQGRFDGKL